MSPTIAVLANRRCVVLGSSGFIGTNLCQTLFRAGANVVRVDTRPPAADLPDIERHEIKLADTAAIEEIIKPKDVLFHLVSTTVPGSAKTAEQDVTENVLPTLRLLDICSRSDVGRIVFASSGGTVYGSEAPVPTPEDAPANPISSYGAQKLAIEKYLSVYRKLHRLDSFVLRISNPFGPYQTHPGQGLIASVIRHALAETAVNVFGDGLAMRDYVYIDDVVEAMMLAAAVDGAEAPRTYNIGTGIGRSINDVIQAVEAVHRTPIRVNQVPARAVDVPVSILDISRAAEFLRWRPVTDWEVAIKLSYAWAKARRGQQDLP
jgi:UDP-glucose 4-epimerase